MTYTSEWVDHCLDACVKPAALYSGCRKIIRPWRLSFSDLDDSLQLKDAGFTTNKLRYLERAYLHEESIAVAVQLWDRRKAQAKYGSVGFTCYNHFIKTDPNKKSKRASVMGPCIQSITITLVDKRTYGVDVFYRTTELFKKFPADLVFLRDVLLEPFDFDGMKMQEMRCHFANVTAHPMYWVTLVPHMSDPVHELELIGLDDPYFRDWIVKWTARYTCDEYHRGIAKFAQALRVKKDALERIPPKRLRILNEYLRDTHPGHRNEYEDEEDDE